MLTRKALSLLVALTLALTLLGAGCGSSDPTPPTPGIPTPDDSDDRYGGTLRVGFASNLETPDPNLARTGTALKYTSAITDSLVSLDQEGMPQPLLAKDWDIEDGIIYTFYLEEGVVFHDGEPFNAEAVKFNMEERLLHPDFPNRKQVSMERIAEVNVLAEHTVQFVLSEVDALLLEVLAGPELGFVSPKAVREMGADFEDNPVGLGPFVFKEFIPDGHVRVERFDDYWQGRPYLDAIEFRIIPEESTRVLELEMDNLDVLLYVSPREANRLRENYVVDPGVRLTLTWLAMNLRMPIFDDIRMRQALSHAVDRDLLIEEIHAGQADPGVAGLPPASWGFEPSVVPYHYDPDRTAELLDDLGWIMGSDGFRHKDGEKLHFELRTSSTSLRLMETEVLQQFLRDVGIDSEIYMTEPAAYNQDMRSENFELGIWGLGGSVHPANQAERSHSDYYWNPSRHYIAEIDQLIEKAGVETDVDVIKELLSDFQHLVNEHLPAIWLFHSGSITVMSERVQELYIDAANYKRFHNTWLDQ